MLNAHGHLQDFLRRVRPRSSYFIVYLSKVTLRCHVKNSNNSHDWAGMRLATLHNE